MTVTWYIVRMTGRLSALAIAGHSWAETGVQVCFSDQTFFLIVEIKKVRSYSFLVDWTFLLDLYDTKRKLHCVGFSEKGTVISVCMVIPAALLSPTHKESCVPMSAAAPTWAPMGYRPHTLIMEEEKAFETIDCCFWFHQCVHKTG